MSNFATLLCCIDGRIHHKLIKYIKKSSQKEFIDQITFPGIISEIISKKRSHYDTLKANINISIHHHSSNLIYITGHWDCAAYSKSDAQQKEELIKSISILEHSFPDATIKALWQDESFNVTPLN